MSDSAPDPATEPEVVGIEPDPLSAVAYTSTPTVVFTDQDVVDLLFAARRWNAHYGITGRLVALEAGGRVTRFYQWIEGPEAALEACLERIEADDRHTDIEIQFRGRVQGRKFPGWDMGIQEVGADGFRAEVAKDV